MSIDNYAFVLLEPRSEDDVGSLASDSGEGQQFIHCLGNVAAEVGDYFSRGANDRFRFVAEEASRVDIGLQLLRFERGEILNRRILCEDHRRDLIYSNVGRLRGENGGYQQFPGAAVGESAGYSRIHLVKAGYDLAHALGGQGIVCGDSACRFRARCRFLFRSAGLRGGGASIRLNGAESRYDTSLAGCRSAFHAVGAFVTSAATGLTRHISARHRGPPEQWLW